MFTRQLRWACPAAGILECCGGGGDHLPPVGLLAFAAAVEKALAASACALNSRTLDIDLLLYEDRRVDLPYLQIPSRMHERRFALPAHGPGAEIRSGVGRARDCLAALTKQSSWPLSASRSSFGCLTNDRSLLFALPML